MARERLPLGGTTPANEPCIMVSRDDDYFTKMKAEALVFKRQLERAFPDPPDGVYFAVKSNSHEFGSYLDICVVYDDSDEEQMNFAYSVEDTAPAEWDEQARAELACIADYNPK